MRTIYAKILTWFLLTLVVCLAGFVGTSVYLSRAFPRPGSPMARMNEFMLEQVLSIYKEKGSIAANKYLTAFNVKVQGSTCWWIRGAGMPSLAKTVPRCFTMRGPAAGAGSRSCVPRARWSSRRRRETRATACSW